MPSAEVRRFLEAQREPGPPFEIVALDTILPTEKLSVYDFAIAPRDLAPSEAEAEQFIREVERRYAWPAALESEIARWWEV